VTRPQELVERALEQSRADDCVVIVEEASEANLRWASNTLTTNGVARGNTVTIISVFGSSSGVVSRQGVNLAELPNVLAASESSARESPPAEDSAPLIGQSASSGDWDAPAAETSINVFSSFSPALGSTFQQAGSQDRLLFGFAYHRMASTFVGSSGGLRSRHDQPTGHVEFNGKSSDFARSAWVGLPTTDFTDVDVAAVDADLARRLAWAARSVDLPAGRYETILPPSAVADFMTYLYWSAEARQAFEGRSVFSRPGGGTRVSDRLTEVPLTLRSDPAARGLDCSPFLVTHRSGTDRSVFDNGALLVPTPWISSGVLSALVQTRHSSRLTGLPFTPYIDNLILETADPAGDLDGLIGGTDRGLLLTCLWYIREVDPRTLLLTGLTRDGVYLVEGGEVIGAVNNFRFNESPVDLLARVSQVGSTGRTLPREWADDFTRVAMPAMRVPDFNMSSVSQAS
jgi:predicted Zn-dependent protease